MTSAFATDLVNWTQQCLVEFVRKPEMERKRIPPAAAAFLAQADAHSALDG